MWRTRMPMWGAIILKSGREKGEMLIQDETTIATTQFRTCTKPFAQESPVT